MTEQTFKGVGGWVLTVIPGVDGEHYFTISHPVNPDDPTEGQKFYQATTIGNPYGAPVLVQEPSLRISAHRAGIDLDADIVGFVIIQDGKVSERASLSNLVYMKGASVDVNLAGELIINDEARGFIQMLVLPDKNRLVGYVAYVGPTKPEQVKVLELEDLALLFIGD